jgi:hypothetical protein
VSGRAAAKGRASSSRRRRAGARRASSLKGAENGSDFVLELIVDGTELEAGVDYELKENRNLWIA